MKPPPYEDVLCRYFPKPGPSNTKHLLEAVSRRAGDLQIETVLIPSYTGKTAFEALKVLGDRAKIIAVTHAMGFIKPDFQELSLESRHKLESLGVKVLTCQHAFGGVGRAVRKKMGTYQVDEIMAYTLRIFGQGAKVAIELVLMAADAGLIRTDRNVISTGGTESGIDTALVIQPANSANFFDLKVKEVICKPAGF